MNQMKTNYNINDFFPLHDNVIVEPIKITNKDGFVRPQQEEDKAEIGKVLSMGPGVSELNHKPLKVGDIVLFNKYSTTHTDIDDNLLVRFEDIIAVQKNGK